MRELLVRAGSVGLGCALWATAGGVSRAEPPTISPETTLYVEPVRADGYVDYAAALDAAFGDADAAVEDNVFAGMLAQWESPFEADSDTQRVLDGWYKRFAIAPPVAGEGFVWWNDHAQRLGLDDEAIGAALDVGLNGPWSEIDAPELSAWLDEMKAPLDRIVEAIERSGYFAPVVLIPDSPAVAGVLLPHLSYHRAVGRSLTMRALRSLQAGDVDATIAALIALERFARWQTREPASISNLVGISIDSLTRTIYPDLLAHSKLNRAHLNRLQRERDARPASTPPTRVYGEAEQVLALDLLQRSAAGDAHIGETLDWMFDMGDNPVAETLTRVTTDPRFDLDAALRRLRKVWGQTLPVPERQSERVAWCERSEAFNEQLKECGLRLWVALATAATQGIPEGQADLAAQAAADLFASQMLPGHPAYVRTAAQAEMYDDLETVALALAEHRLIHGAYPESLDDLPVTDRREIPEDFIAGQLVKYRVVNDGQGFVLYSVNVDLEDDGGVDDPREGDLAIRVNAD